MAIYSKAWSVGGNGIAINYYMIIVFNLLLIIGGIIAAFSQAAISVIIDILTFFFGIIGVAICSN
jgi:hypothetical protein